MRANSLYQKRKKRAEQHPEEAEQLQEIVDALYQYSSILEADAFESGFRLGAKMMLDILQPDSNVVMPEKKP